MPLLDYDALTGISRHGHSLAREASCINGAENLWHLLTTPSLLFDNGGLRRGAISAARNRPILILPLLL